MNPQRGSVNLGGGCVIEGFHSAIVSWAVCHRIFAERFVTYLVVWAIQTQGQGEKSIFSGCGERWDA